jgi:hypothetical protein
VQQATDKIQEEVVRGQKKLTSDETNRTIRKKIAPTLSMLEEGSGNAPLTRDSPASDRAEKKKKRQSRTDLAKYLPDPSVPLPSPLNGDKSSKRRTVELKESPVERVGSGSLAKRMSRRISQEELATMEPAQSTIAKSPSSPGVSSTGATPPPALSPIAEEPMSPPIRRGLPKTATPPLSRVQPTDNTEPPKKLSPRALTESAPTKKSPREAAAVPPAPSTPTISVSLHHHTDKADPNSQKASPSPVPKLVVPTSTPATSDGEGSVTSRLAGAVSPRSTADALKNAVDSALLLLREITDDLSHVEPRVSIAFEVTELAPLVKTVKSVKAVRFACIPFASVIKGK